MIVQGEEFGEVVVLRAQPSGFLLGASLGDECVPYRTCVDGLVLAMHIERIGIEVLPVNGLHRPVGARVGDDFQ